MRVAMPGSSILQMFADVAPKRLALIYKLHAADHLIAYLYLCPAFTPFIRYPIPSPSLSHACV